MIRPRAAGSDPLVESASSISTTFADTFNHYSFHLIELNRVIGWKNARAPVLAVGGRATLKMVEHVAPGSRKCCSGRRPPLFRTADRSRHLADGESREVPETSDAGPRR